MLGLRCSEKAPYGFCSDFCTDPRFYNRIIATKPPSDCKYLVTRMLLAWFLKGSGFIA